MEIMVTNGHEESFARDNSSGFAKLVQSPTRIISTVTFVDKFTWRLERMPKQMEKSGFSVNNVRNGFIQIVKCRMDIQTFLNLSIKMKS